MIEVSTAVLTLITGDGYDLSFGRMFAYRNEDGLTVWSFLMDLSTWEALGRPSEITVSVYPGDTLSEAE